MSDLIRPGETPEATLARLEHLPGPAYTAAIESDAGQLLLAMLRARRRAALRETRRLTGVPS
jgi:hypothetical protein